MSKRKNQRLENRNANARRVLDFVRKYDHETGLSPCMEEIAEACFMSRSSVLRYLDLLEAWEHLTRQPGVPRSIRLLKGGRHL
jgi:DNA-binding IclR family transcriptional regulator